MQFVVTQEQSGERLDRLVARHAGLSRREARTLIATGQVMVNRRPMRILTRPIKSGATIAVEAAQVSATRATEQHTRAPTGPQARPSTPIERAPAQQHAPLDIIYLDRWVVVVNKPPKLLSEHDRFGSPSVESELPKVLERRGEHTRLWLVHRLDAGTSGVLILARTPGAAAALNATFHDKTAQKTYLALCKGELRASHNVDAPVGRAQRTRHCVRADGKPAQTLVTPVAHGRGVTLVECLPRTGLTHQIRVHMAHLCYPLMGDRLYGGPGYTVGEAPMPIGRAMLHAQRLVLPHPKENRALDLVAPPPDDFVGLAKSLGLLANCFKDSGHAEITADRPQGR
jgi:23S rRNA pseudouridine1911/1915/1917 synthase